MVRCDDCVAIDCLLVRLSNIGSITVSPTMAAAHLSKWSWLRAKEVFTVPHRFRLEPVGTRRILTRIFWVGYLPNKQGTPSKISTWIPVGSEFPDGSNGTKSNQIPTGSNWFQVDPPGSTWKNSHFSKFTNNSKRFILSQGTKSNVLLTQNSNNATAVTTILF